MITLYVQIYTINTELACVLHVSSKLIEHLFYWCAFSAKLVNNDKDSFIFFQKFKIADQSIYRTLLTKLFYQVLL